MDSFVLFVSKEITLEQDVQVSSGNLGSNNEIDIQKDVVINGNLYADEIEIDKNTEINGDASFNELEIKKESKIYRGASSGIDVSDMLLATIKDKNITTFTDETVETGKTYYCRVFVNDRAG